MQQPSRSVLLIVATTALLALGIIYWPTPTSLALMKKAINDQLATMANVSFIKSSPAIATSVNEDRSRFDPLVKAFFQQQQASRQQTMQQSMQQAQQAQQGYHFLYNAIVPEVQCPRLVRVGSTDDGGKWICDPWLLPANCTVYSLGVGGDVSFEMELSNITNVRCNTYSADPNAQYAALVSAVPKMTFNPWRLAQVDNLAANIRSIRGIMQQYGHRYIDVLKVDVEGAEHEIIPEILSVDKPIACQILIEVHGEVNKHAKLIEQFAKSRYMLFSYEINGYSITACEYSFIHWSCMQSYGISDVLHRLFNVSRRK